MYETEKINFDFTKIGEEHNAGLAYIFDDLKMHPSIYDANLNAEVYYKVNEITGTYVRTKSFLFNSKSEY